VSFSISRNTPNSNASSAFVVGFSLSSLGRRFGSARKPAWNPYHPQTQGKVERWHQTLKTASYWKNYFLPGDLEGQVGAFVNHYNNRPLNHQRQAAKHQFMMSQILRYETGSLAPNSLMMDTSSTGITGIHEHRRVLPRTVRATMSTH